MSAKLRIKAKGIEIEWEGDVEYLKNDLPDLISKIVAALGVSATDEFDEGEVPDGRTGEKTSLQVALAAKVKPATAPGLFKVALAKGPLRNN